MRLGLALAVVLLVAAPVGAYTCVGNSCTLDLTFTESTTYTSGQPLTDLKDHVFTYKKAGGPDQTMTITASKPQGGGTITTKTAAQTVAPCTSATFTGSLVSRTTAGATSAAAVAPTATVDRTKLATGAPDPACTTPSGATGVNFQ